MRRGRGGVREGSHQLHWRTILPPDRATRIQFGILREEDRKGEVP